MRAGRTIVESVYYGKVQAWKEAIDDISRINRKLGGRSLAHAHFVFICCPIIYDTTVVGLLLNVYEGPLLGADETKLGLLGSVLIN